MIKKLSALTLAASVLASPAFAKISFSLDIEALTSANGTTQLSNSGLLVLVVDTADNGFAGPSTGSLVSGDDKVVATWDLSQVGPGTSDITLLTEGGVAWDADWSESDPLALYWFPALSQSNQSPGSDEAYGVFSDKAGIASGDAWKLPADGTLLHSLKLFTEAASKLVIAGDFPSSLGKAAFSVMNPPSSATAPTVVTATPAGGKIELTWNGGSSAGGGYIIQRSKAGSGVWSTVGFAGDGATSYSDDMITAGIEYAYRLIASNGLGSDTNTLADMIQAERSVFASVAARAFVQEGFANARRMFGQVDVVGDDATKNVIFQASGPWLGQPGIDVPNALVDPTLRVWKHPNPDFANRVLVATNDNWMEQTIAADALTIDKVQADFGTSVSTRRVNVFADNPPSKDASWVGAVDRGTPYTFMITSADGTSGNGHIGIYNAEGATAFANSDNRIAALVTRGYLAPGTDRSTKMFGEFSIEGSVPKTVLIRGLGPNLTYFGLGGVDGSGNPIEDVRIAEDPSIRLWRHPDPVNNFPTRVLVATNDNWETQTPADSVITDLDSIKAAQQYVLDFDPRQVAFDAGSKDAALLVTLEPGVYSFLLDTKEFGDSGIGLLGIYEIEVEGL